MSLGVVIIKNNIKMFFIINVSLIIIKLLINSSEFEEIEKSKERLSIYN